MASKYLIRIPNKKKSAIVTKSLRTIEILHQTMSLSKGIPFFSMFWSNHKKVFQKLTGRRLWLSHIWRAETLLIMVSVTDVSLQKLLKHLGWSFLRKYSWLSNIMDVWLGSEYASADSKTLHINFLKKWSSWPIR